MVFRHILRAVLSATAAGTLTFALAGPAVAAPSCDPPGLTVAITKATAQKAVLDAEAALAAAAGDPVKIAAAQAVLDAAKAALAATQAQLASDADRIVHLIAVRLAIREHKNCTEA